MQSLLTSFFISNQVYVAIIVLVIASVYLFNRMMKKFKITINLKKLFYDSQDLKINTMFTSISDSEKQRIILINKLIDEKIIDKKYLKKAINISKNILSPTESSPTVSTSPTISSPTVSTSSPASIPTVSTSSSTVSSPAVSTSSTVSPIVSVASIPVLTNTTTVTSTNK
jgi:hypothetical protein